MVGGGGKSFWLDKNNPASTSPTLGRVFLLGIVFLENFI